MAITIQPLVQGDTNYIGKHNANYNEIAQAIDGIQAQMGQSLQATLSTVAAFRAIFGTDSRIVGDNSFVASLDGTSLNMTAGFAWFPTNSKLINNANGQSVSFVGLPSGTYYINIDDAGLIKAESAQLDGLWSVVWDGSSTLSNLTRLIGFVWGAEDFIAAQTSTALGESYTALVDRLEAGELAHKAMLSKTVAGTDIVLTNKEAMESFALHLTGSQSSDINVIVPDSAKQYLIINDCTAGYTVTVKTAAGQGVAVPDNARSVLYCDGTNVMALTEETGQQPYDIGVMHNGLIPAAISLIRLKPSRPLTFPAGLPNSTAIAGAAATGNAVFSLKKNGVEVGTLTFAAGLPDGAWAMASETTVNVGDELTLIAPSQDATLANIGLVLAGTR